MSTLFVTGTDTDAGKTIVTAGLLTAANQLGWRSLGIKPVAAGADYINGELINGDAAMLAACSSVDVEPSEITGYCFEKPAAPHLLGIEQQTDIRVDTMLQHAESLVALTKPEFVLVEGAGGWRVPLDMEGRMLSDLPRASRWPVILVVGVKLGCLNHAQLTMEAIDKDGLILSGWIANCIDPNMGYQRENLDTLKAMIPAPLLGEIPWLANPTPEAVASYIDKGKLVQIGCRHCQG